MLRPVRVLCAVTAVAALAGCGDDGRIEVGEAFTWNDFTIEEGWSVEPISRSTGMEQVVTPEISGTIVNNSSEKRAAIFQVVLLDADEPVATVNCSSPEMAEGQSTQFLCPGLSSSMPEAFDSVRVQEFAGADDRSDL